MSGPALTQAVGSHVPDTTSNITCRPKRVLASQPPLAYATLQTCDPTQFNHDTVQSPPTYATLQQCNPTLYLNSAQCQPSNAATSTAPQLGTLNGRFRRLYICLSETNTDNADIKYVYQNFRKCGCIININKRTEVLYHPPPYIRLDFLRSQIFKKLICGGHFKFQ